MVAKSNLDEFGMGSGGVDSCHGPSKSVWRSGIPYTLHNTAGHSGSALNHRSFKADTGAFPRCEHLPNFFVYPFTLTSNSILLTSATQGAICWVVVNRLKLMMLKMANVVDYLLCYVMYFAYSLVLSTSHGFFSPKLRPGELLHGHNSVNSQQILMGLQGTLPMSLDRVHPKYQND